MVVTTQALSQTPGIIPYTACLNGANNNYNYALNERIDRQIPIYENLIAISVLKDMHTYIILGKRYRISVLLDSGSNIFLINEQLVEDLHIPYDSRTDAVQIQGFTGETIASGGTNFTIYLFLEIRNNQHLSLVSCEIAPAGKYGMIIPFGWWHQEHTITDIANSKNWSFDDHNCQSDLLPEDEGICVEWDADVLNNPNAVVIGRMEKVDDEKVTIIDRLPERYHGYLDLFCPSTAEKLAPRRTFDHAINLKPDTQPPWGPIYPLSQKHLE